MFIVGDTIKQALQQINEQYTHIKMVFIVGPNQTGSTTNKQQYIHSRSVFIVGDTIKQALQQINNDILISEWCLL